MSAKRSFRVSVWLVAGVATFGVAQDAWSKPKRGERHGWITAQSRYGKGSISAPTRPGQWGPEVRLPGGTWISCKLDCKNTLRAETIDFWRERENELPDCGRC